MTVFVVYSPEVVLAVYATHQLAYDSMRDKGEWVDADTFVDRSGVTFTISEQPVEGG